MNGLASMNGAYAFEKHKSLLDLIGKECPKVSRVYVTLALPRSTNRHLRNRNYRFVGRCNCEVLYFNQLLRNCYQCSRTVFYLDHGLQLLCVARVFAADGLHPSFQGVAVMASHLHGLCFTRKGASTAWSSTIYVKSHPTKLHQHRHAAMPPLLNRRRLRLQPFRASYIKDTTQLLREISDLCVPEESHLVTLESAKHLSITL